MSAIALLHAALATPYDYGMLKFDNTTLERVVGHGTAAFVRIDKEYSYGDEDDAFRELAKLVGQSGAKLIVGTVGVADPPSPPYRGEGEYGESPPEEEEEVDPNGWRDGQDIAAKYGVALDDFPKFRFFPAAGGAPKNFEGKADKESFLRYVQEEAGVWIGLPGQLGDMHGLAKEFAGAKDKAKVLKKAEAAAAKLPTADAEHGKYYVKVMTKASADGEFVTKETARLKKMQDDGSVSAAKKEQFGRRLNILSSFA